MDVLAGTKESKILAIYNEDVSKNSHALKQIIQASSEIPIIRNFKNTVG